MTGATAGSDAAIGAGAWLFGPRVDWLFGAGALYLLSVPLLLLLTHVAGVPGWSVALGAVFALFISGPHYGATILRVYEQREDRRRYAFFAVWVTLALVALFLVALHQPFVGSLLVTAYATWSPWHFSGQNYGLALMFLRRRGVPVPPTAKRWLYLSFVLSFGLTFLVLHGGAYSLAVASVPISGGVFQFLSLELSAGVLDWAVPAVVGAYVLSLAGALHGLLRGAPLRALLPAISLVCVQALWFAIPGAMRVLGGAPPSGLAFAVVWVSACHAAQYLWVTSYYARREDPSLRMAPYLGRALMAGSTVTIFPALLFAPGLLGTVPWDLGLPILLFSVVNLHHFILDGAIWKLRDGRVARFLLRDAPAEAAAESPTGRRRGFARVAFTLLGVVSLGVAAVDVTQREFVINRVGSDMDRALRAAERLAWIGRDGPPLHNQIANYFAQTRRPDRAADEYRHSLALYPTAEAWAGLGRLHVEARRFEQARAAFRSALALEPGDVSVQADLPRVEQTLRLGRAGEGRGS